MMTSINYFHWNSLKLHFNNPPSVYSVNFWCKINVARHLVRSYGVHGKLK